MEKLTLAETKREEEKQKKIEKLREQVTFTHDFLFKNLSELNISLYEKIVPRINRIKRKTQPTHIRPTHITTTYIPPSPPSYHRPNFYSFQNIPKNKTTIFDYQHMKLQQQKSTPPPKTDFHAMHTKLGTDKHTSLILGDSNSVSQLYMDNTHATSYCCFPGATLSRTKDFVKIKHDVLLLKNYGYTFKNVIVNFGSNDADMVSKTLSLSNTENYSQLTRTIVNGLSVNDEDNDSWNHVSTFDPLNIDHLYDAELVKQIDCAFQPFFRNLKKNINFVLCRSKHYSISAP